MRLRVLMVAFVFAVSNAASAEVKDVAPGGFTVENTQVVPTDPATTWKALVQDVDRWWPKDHSWWGAEATLRIDARAGGCFCELAGARQAQHMTVTFVDPGKTLRLVGGLGPLQGMGLHGALEFRLSSVPEGTLITLHYRVGGYSPDDLSKLAPVVDQVQGLQLGGLAKFLSDGSAARSAP